MGKRADFGMGVSLRFAMNWSKERTWLKQDEIVLPLNRKIVKAHEVPALHIVAHIARTCS